MAPFAAEVLRKGLPILDRNLRGLIEEIQEKARTTYKESRGTNLEETALAVCKEVQKWETGDQDYLASNIENLIFTLEELFSKTQENRPLFAQIEKLRKDEDIVKQYSILSIIISNTPEYSVNSETKFANKPISKKIVNSINYSVGTTSALAAFASALAAFASTLAAFVYYKHGTSNPENQNYIYIEVFAVSLLVFFLVFLLIIEKWLKKSK
jgi:hypothetical protein